MTHALPDRDRDDSEFTISHRLTRNPLAWAFSLARIVALFMLFAVCLRALTVVPIWPLIPGLFFAWLITREVSKILEVDRSVFSFDRDGLHIERGRFGGVRTRESHPYASVRNVVQSGLGQIRIDIASDDGVRTPERIHVPPVTTEDVMELIVDHVRNAEPDLLFAIREEDALHYSTEPQPEALLPAIRGQTSSARGPKTRGGDVHIGDEVLRRRGTSTLDRAGHPPLLTVTPTEIFNGSGLLLGTIESRRGDRARLRLFDDRVYEVREGVIESAGERFAWADSRACEDLVLRFVAPIPSGLAAILWLAYGRLSRVLRPVP